MMLSYFWSIAPNETLKALPKEMSLLIIPIVFSFIPNYSSKQKELLIKYYSYTMIIYAIYFLSRACIRFYIHKEVAVFFYHGPQNDIDTGLVPRLLNAIHVSVYMTVAFIYFYTKPNKRIIHKILSFFLFFFIILLSSKNIIVILLVMIICYSIFYSKSANKARLINLLIITLLLGTIFSFKEIKERFLIEFTSNVEKESNEVQSVNKISIYEAWNNDKFTDNDFFPGGAFRVYQIRIFLELMNENPVFWNGFGLNASQKKLIEKEKEHKLYSGYGSFNFHNQYVQNFSELGFIGFILLVVMMIVNLRKGFTTVNFSHISFSILMISVFLTESFLWRQRGVNFFILFYCFFNFISKQKPEAERLSSTML
ncbi:O-antigen ligase family protein [Flavobacterium branchiophilum]|nr:O-antigen ligase family protein [Flavobacterium branchiophilum]